VTRGAVSRALARRPGRVWWLAGLVVVGGLLFTAGLLVEVRCAVGQCPRPRVRRWLDLDVLGGLPRLFTTWVFVAVAVLAAVAAVRSVSWARVWWAAVAAGGVVLAVAKVVSSHSALEQDGGRVATLVGGVVAAVLGLSGLWVAGRRWSLPGASAVTVALAVYAVAALGLDQVTAGVRAVGGSPVALAVASYVEEGGEGLAAVAVLAVVSAWGPRR
jgi:hypothetical protein